MSTYITDGETPKTAAQAWAAIHQACGNAVRAQLEDDDIEGAFYYAKRMAKAEARFPPDHPIHFTQAVVSGDLSEAEKLALGHKDHEICRHKPGVFAQIKLVSAADMDDKHPGFPALLQRHAETEQDLGIRGVLSKSVFGGRP